MKYVSSPQINQTWLLPFIHDSYCLSCLSSHRALLVREVLLVQLVQLACPVDLALRVPQVLLERREHL